ncbi:hypothetical protein EJ377_17895 [Chryseobacterium arthrosphaerae]|uniref:Uncharacterized protein n=1 Tax=Chryseobacterium arthrosphaerae TaxID=651561 RepID=A0A432DT79_9FLAO|nr:hypothetical protein EJ377_17895 [Chryseobacterium arthrosphaerae]
MPGITHYFGEIESEIGFIAENGGYVIYKDQELFADTLEYKYIVDIIKAVREIPGAKPYCQLKKWRITKPKISSL